MQLAEFIRSRVRFMYINISRVLGFYGISNRLCHCVGLFIGFGFFGIWASRAFLGLAFLVSNLGLS